MRDAPPLGVFGGTFDPVHIGHLRLAEEACETLGLSGVRWIPAGQPKHREAPQVTPAHRLQMVRLAIAGNALFSVDTTEVESGEASYTVPTLERLREKLGPRQPLVLLLGADAYAGLNTWHRWQEIFSLAHLAIAHRPGYTIDNASLPAPLAEEHLRRHTQEKAAQTSAAAGTIITFPMTPLAISATHVRQTLEQGRSPRYLLPRPVIDYIDLHQLYRNNDGS